MRGWLNRCSLANSQLCRELHQRRQFRGDSSSLFSPSARRLGASARGRSQCGAAAGWAPSPSSCRRWGSRRSRQPPECSTTSRRAGRCAASKSAAAGARRKGQRLNRRRRLPPLPPPSPPPTWGLPTGAASAAPQSGTGSHGDCRRLDGGLSHSAGAVCATTMRRFRACSSRVRCAVAGSARLE